MQKEIIANTSDAVTETEGLPKPTKVGWTDGRPARGAPLLLFMGNWRRNNSDNFLTVFLIQHGGINSIL